METILSTPKKSNPFFTILKWIAGIIAVLFLLITIPAFIKALSTYDERKGGKAPATIVSLQDEAVSSITLDQIADVASTTSKLTSIQRDDSKATFKGKAVAVEILVENVERSGSKFLITGNPGIKFTLFGHTSNTVTPTILVTPSSKEESAFLEGLKPNQLVKVKGRIQSFSDDAFRLEPAILYTSESAKPSARPKVIAKEGEVSAAEYAKSLAHDRAQEENVAYVLKQNALEELKESKTAAYDNRFTADCISAKQQNAITLGGMNQKEARSHAASVCKEGLPTFSVCIAKPGTTYKSCYGSAVPSAE